MKNGKIKAKNIISEIIKMILDNMKHDIYLLYIICLTNSMRRLWGLEAGGFPLIGCRW